MERKSRKEERPRPAAVAQERDGQADRATRPVIRVHGMVPAEIVQNEATAAAEEAVAKAIAGSTTTGQ